jgi:hypothetical protein
MSGHATIHQPSPRPARIKQHWKVLCRQIGERRAGTRGERLAAAYVANQFTRFHLKAIRTEDFPCTSLHKSSAVFEVCHGSRFKHIPAHVLVGSSSTPGETCLEGDLLWVEMPEQAARSFDGGVKGKIVMLFGPLPTHVELHRRMVAAGPLAVVHIDDRLPFTWLKDDGVYPAWVKRYGMFPIVTVPYRSAWNLKKLGCKRARLRVSVDQKEGISQNVSGEITGRRPELPIILVSAHHDTQCHNTGADDNASGVVAILEMAALLGKQNFLRTIRFISFGVEEQLSVGAARYVTDHRAALDHIGMIFNLDAVASVLGHFQLYRAGSAEFGACLTKELARHGLDVVEKPDVSPFGDHFPFSAFGIPAASLYRPNMDSGMRWQHHSSHDNLDEVSAEELTRAVAAVTGLLRSLANQATWPFKRGLPPPQQKRTQQLFKDLYDLES